MYILRIQSYRAGPEGASSRPLKISHRAWFLVLIVDIILMRDRLVTLCRHGPPLDRFYANLPQQSQ